MAFLPSKAASSLTYSAFRLCCDICEPLVNVVLARCRRASNGDTLSSKLDTRDLGDELNNSFENNEDEEAVDEADEFENDFVL